MPILSIIIGFYLRPRRIAQDLVWISPSEGRMLVFLVVGCLTFYLSSLARQPFAGTAALANVSRPAMVAANLYSFFALVPLLLYAIAAVSRICLWALGLKVTWSQARLGLFAAFLALTPAELLQTALYGIAPDGMIAHLFSWAELALFLIFWALLLIAAVHRNAASPDEPMHAA